jgi:hypothetical protein
MAASSSCSGLEIDGDRATRVRERDGVGTIPAIKPVRATFTLQCIVTIPTGERIVCEVSGNCIGVCRTDDVLYEVVAIPLGVATKAAGIKIDVDRTGAGVVNRVCASLAIQNVRAGEANQRVIPAKSDSEYQRSRSR